MTYPNDRESKAPFQSFSITAHTINMKFYLSQQHHNLWSQGLSLFSSHQHQPPCGSFIARALFCSAGLQSQWGAHKHPAQGTAEQTPVSDCQGPYWADGELQLIHTLKKLSTNLLKHRTCSYSTINILEYSQIQFVMFK